MEDQYGLEGGIPRPGTHELIVDGGNNLFDIILRVSPHIEAYVAKAWNEDKPPTPKVLMRLDFSSRRAHIFPQVTFRNEDLYGPKYRKIREIILDLPEQITPPDDGDAAQRVIDKIMPLGFMKQSEYGLGFVMLMRPFVYAVESLEGLSRIVISHEETTRIEHGTYYFESAEYRALAEGMHRITRRYQDESLKDRDIFAYNSVLSRISPDKFPEKSRPYAAGTIFKLLGGTNVERTQLVGKDRLGILNIIASNAKNIARRDPKEFIQLQKDIEIVSLDEIIRKFHTLLRGKSSESDWQNLLEVNPFILSMLFGQPIVMLQPSAAVGGLTITGSGTRIADFVARNTLTNNAALVELKKPSVGLMGAAYRNVFSPTPELMGAVVQILDQRLILTTEIANLTRRSKTDLEVYAVECIIVAGRTPPNDKISSFELMRGQLKDVRIVTFDELLERLSTLRELLSGERYISPEESDEELPDEDWGEEPYWEHRLLRGEEEPIAEDGQPSLF